MDIIKNLKYRLLTKYMDRRETEYKCPVCAIDPAACEVVQADRAVMKGMRMRAGEPLPGETYGRGK